jgi:hypothetical protein
MIQTSGSSQAVPPYITSGRAKVRSLFCFKLWGFRLKRTIEEWKPCGVAGSEAYEVSSSGRVRKDGKMRKLSTSSHGYKVVQIRINGRWKMWYVHRLVAITFIPNPLRAEVVNHRDRNRTNNRVSNIEWVTQYENTRHRHASDVRELLYKRFDAAIVELVALRDAVCGGN